MSGLVSGSQFSCGPSPSPFIRGNPCCSPVTRLGLKLLSEQYGAGVDRAECDWNSLDQFALITSFRFFMWADGGVYYVMLVAVAECGCWTESGPGGSFS